MKSSTFRSGKLIGVLVFALGSACVDTPSLLASDVDEPGHSTQHLLLVLKLTNTGVVVVSNRMVELPLPKLKV
jgi:hypothetical protein